ESKGEFPIVAVKTYKFDEPGYDDKQRHLQHQLDTEVSILTHLSNSGCKSIPKLLGRTRSTIIMEKIEDIDTYQISLQNWEFVSHLLPAITNAYVDVYNHGVVNWDPKARTFILIPDNNGEFLVKVYDFNVASLINGDGEILIPKGLVKSSSSA